MGGSPSIDFPGPSEEERELQREQVELLRQQRDVLSRQVREQNLLAPFLFEEAGVIPQFDENGEIIAFERGDDPARDLREELELGFLERQRDALAGNLPVSPALERELGEFERIEMERLRKALGPGFETGTPGIEGINRLKQTQLELRDAARRGDLTLFEQLSTASAAKNRASTSDFFTQLFGQNANQLSLAGGIGSNAAGFNSPLTNLFNNRAGQFQANKAEAQFSTDTMGAIFGALGSIGGSAAGGAFGAGGYFGRR